MEIALINEIARRGGIILFLLHEDDNGDTNDNENDEGDNYLMISMDIAFMI